MRWFVQLIRWRLRLSVPTGLVASVIEAVGFALLVLGLWMIFPPAAVIAAGSLLIMLGIGMATYVE